MPLPRPPDTNQLRFLNAFFRSRGWKVTGLWDERAVGFTIATQRMIGVNPDGIWGPQSQQALERFLAGVGTQHVAAAIQQTFNNTAPQMAQSYAPGFPSMPSISGPSGTGISGPAAPGWSPPRNQQEIREAIIRNYGYFAAFMNEPEIGNLLTQGAMEGWDLAVLQGHLYNTNWWRTKGANEREWIRLTSEDPASAERKRQERQAELRDLSNQIGLRLGDDWLRNMGEDSLKFGWGEAELRDMLATHINIFTAWNEGQVKTLFNRSKDLGGEYFVKSSDDQHLKFAIDVVKGDYTEEDMVGWYRDQAKSKYAHLAKVVDQGVTLKQYFDPHRQQISDLLEVAGEGIDFLNDDRWRRVVTTHNEDGTARAMTLGEVADYTRSLADWRKTKNARASAAQMGKYLMETFGAIAT